MDRHEGDANNRFVSRLGVHFRVFYVVFFCGFRTNGKIYIPDTYQPSLSHTLPLAVILVLVISWIYLANHIAMEPHRISPARITKSHIKHSRRTKSTRKPIGAIKNIFNKISSILLRSRGVLSAPQKLSFGRVVFEIIVTVLVIFLFLII